jgi:hypothetical protein
MTTTTEEKKAGPRAVTIAGVQVAAHGAQRASAASPDRPEDRCACLRAGEGPGLCGWLAHHERGDRPGPCLCRCHKPASLPT